MKIKTKNKGAGKPAFFSKPMKRVNVMLDEDTVKFYTEQGKGNLSEGIRKYWRGPTPRALDAGESPANPSLFSAEVIRPAKVTRKSPRQ